MQWLQSLETKRFDIQIWIVISLLSIIQIAGVLILNLLKPALQSHEIILILVWLIFYICFLTLMVIGKIQKIPTLLPFIIVTIAFVPFFQLGGIKGSLEFNLIAIGVVMVSAVKRKFRYLGIGYYIILLAFALLDDQKLHFLSPLLFIETTNKLEDFVFNLISILTFASFYKLSLLYKNKRLQDLKHELSQQNEEIRMQNIQLKYQQLLLKEANINLEQKISVQTKHLQEQNLAIENYTILSTQELNVPLSRMLEKIDDVELAECDLEIKLQHSIKNLKNVIQKQEMELSA